MQHMGHWHRDKGMNGVYTMPLDVAFTMLPLLTTTSAFR